VGRLNPADYFRQDLCLLTVSYPTVSSLQEVTVSTSTRGDVFVQERMPVVNQQKYYDSTCRFQKSLGILTSPTVGTKSGHLCVDRFSH
jgi:hypothetical protein